MHEDPELSSLVNRRSRVEQQGHQIPQLLLGENLLVTKTRHVGAGLGRLGVVDFGVSGFGIFFIELADLAVVEERGPKRSIGDLGFGHLVTGVAVSTLRGFVVVAELAAGAALCQLLTTLPIAKKSTVRRERQRGLRLCDDLLLLVGRQLAASLRADALRFIRHDPCLPFGGSAFERLVDRAIHQRRIGPHLLGLRGGKGDGHKSEGGNGFEHGTVFPQRLIDGT